MQRLYESALGTFKRGLGGTGLRTGRRQSHREVLGVDKAAALASNWLSWGHGDRPLNGVETGRAHR